MSIGRERNTQREMDEIHAEMERRNPSQSDDDLRHLLIVTFGQMMITSESYPTAEELANKATDLFTTHLRANTVLEARISTRDRLLNKLARTYTPVRKPTDNSPMELTYEAQQYNRFVEDLYKFIEIERNKNEVALRTQQERTNESS